MTDREQRMELALHRILYNAVNPRNCEMTGMDGASSMMFLIRVCKEALGEEHLIWGDPNFILQIREDKHDDERKIDAPKEED